MEVTPSSQPMLDVSLTIVSKTGFATHGIAAKVSSDVSSIHRTAPGRLPLVERCVVKVLFPHGRYTVFDSSFVQRRIKYSHTPSNVIPTMSFVVL